MASPHHYLALRPCIELLTLSESGGQTILIPRGASAFFPAAAASNLAVLRHLELQNATKSASSTSFFLLLTSGGLVVYLLYKSCSNSNSAQFSDSNLRPQWAAKSWLRWLFWGDSSDLGSQYFGPPLPPDLQPKIGKVVEKLQQSHHPNIVYVSPCPNCVRGVCKVRRHHQMLYRKQHHYMPILEHPSASTSGETSPCLNPNSKLSNTENHWYSTLLPPTQTADSADDESSEDEDEKETPTKRRNRHRKCTDTSGMRIPPEGRERVSKQSSMCRDESMDSIAGVSGSMVDLVKGAREVRRLIREASFDSLTSEFSLDVNEGLGHSTASNFDSICNEISRLKDNCDTMGESIDFKSCPGTSIKTSKSDYYLKEPSPALDSLDGSSSPDLRNLHKMIQSAPRTKALWTLTHGFSDNDSNYSPIHREVSPMRYRDTSSTDTRYTHYKPILSSNTSECGDWEWDSEGLNDFVSPEFGAGNMTGSGPHHENWLQDEVLELDLEAELFTSSQNRRYSSSGSDFESSLYRQVRLPPSGRSSVMSAQDSHHDLKSMMVLNISRSSSVNSLKSVDQSTANSSRNRRSKTAASTPTSDESGIEDRSSDLSSMMSSVTTPLSPVHETKEPTVTTPVDDDAFLMQFYQKHRKGHNARRKLHPPSAIPDSHN